MRRMKGAAGLLTALLLAFQLSAQTFALANEDNGIKVVPVNFTHNGYSYEIEGVAKSTDGDYQIKSPARLAARKLPSTYDPRSSGEITTSKRSGFNRCLLGILSPCLRRTGSYKKGA